MVAVLNLSACESHQLGSICRPGARNVQAAAFSGGDLPEKTLTVALTGGPSEFTSSISNLLRSRNIVGTFFVQGSKAIENTEALAQLREQGHLIGNGSYTGTSLLKTSEPILELRRTDATISPFVSGNVFLLHAPFFAFDGRLARVFNRNGLGKYLGPIAFDTANNENFIDDRSCWEFDLGVDACAQQYLAEIERLQRGIVAFHDNDLRSLQLLETLLPQLTAAEFVFVRMDKVPAVRAFIELSGSTIDQTDGNSACNDYE
jgi:peptidoglycan/xylan/chitin deacetylase (PgdA/CDA1 family)